MLEALEGRLQCRDDRRRAKSCARRRPWRREACAAFRPADLPGGDSLEPTHRARQLGSHRHQPAVQPDRRSWRANRSMCRAMPTMRRWRRRDNAVEERAQPSDGARLRDRRQNQERAVVSGKMPVGLRDLSAVVARRQHRSRRCCWRGGSSAARSIASVCAERRGESRIARPEGPLVWLHGASVGELASVLPLIERIRARGISMLVTTGTVTSGGLAEQRLPRGVIHQFMPLDVPRFVRRFLDHWQPDLALFVESDLWPNMMIETSARGVPMVLVNGRLSENSFRALAAPAELDRRPAAAARSLPCAAPPADAARLSELGAPHVVTTGNLKLDVPAPPADPAALASLAGCDRRPAGDRGRFHPCRRRGRGDRRASSAAHEFSGPADADRAAPSRARRRRRRDRALPRA